MSFLILNVLKISFGVLLLLNPGETINSLYEGDYDPTQVSSSIGINIQEQELKSSGYRAIKRYNDGFLLREKLSKKKKLPERISTVFYLILRRPLLPGTMVPYSFPPMKEHSGRLTVVRIKI